MIPIDRTVGTRPDVVERALRLFVEITRRQPTSYYVYVDPGRISVPPVARRALELHRCRALRPQSSPLFYATL